MKFGQVENPLEIDFTLPADTEETKQILEKSSKKNFNVYVGCAKWNRVDLQGFYPRGTKDELSYYSTQFNSIELNATFYNMPSIPQIIKWKDKTPDGFMFFPKITQSISHYRRLLNVNELTDIYCDSVAHFEDKLGMVFLQLHNNFTPKEFPKLKEFINHFPKIIPLAVEVRNENWYADKKVWEEYCHLLEQNGITNLIVDTAGRRDMVHQRLTTTAAFVRFVGCNNPDIDFKRLDEWIETAVRWHNEGLENLYFFVHQHFEESAPLFTAYFIEKLNNRLKLNLKIPKLADDKGEKQENLTLF